MRTLAGILATGALLIAAPNALAAQTIQVSTSGTDAAGCGTGANPPCATIQGALDTSPASNGDTIHVAAGTYNETDTTTVDKNVTIMGDGDDPAVGPSHTVLTVPNNGTGLTQDAAGHYALLFLGAAGSGSTIENMTVDGNHDGDPGQTTGGNHPFRGIDLKDAAATVQHVRITNITDSTFGGSPNAGNGLSVLNSDGTARTVTVNDVRVDNYNKTGMSFNGNGQAGLTANVMNSTVIGAGPTAKIAQNGLEFDNSAAGTLSGTAVSGNECDVAGACGPDSFTQSQGLGVLAYQSGPITLSDNTLSSNDVGAFYGYPNSGTGTISDNMVSANRDEGLLLNQGTADVSGNVIKGSPLGVQLQSFDSGGDTGNAIGNLTGNAIRGNGTGISLDDDNTANPTRIPVLTAHKNQISQNSTSGIANNVNEPQDATSNYWGCNAGPGKPGCDGVSGIGAAKVATNPFLTIAPPVAPRIHAAFGSPSVKVGGKTDLRFRIGNPNSGTQLTGVGFSDTLPAGLVVSNPNGVKGACGGGTISAPAGSTHITLTGASLFPTGSCSFSVSVTAKTAGTKTDSTGPVTSTEGGNGAAASASLAVLKPTPKLTLTVNPRKARATVPTTFAFHVTGPGGAVKGALVVFAGRLSHTDASGDASMTITFKHKGSHKARASKDGFKSSSPVTVKIQSPPH